MQKENDKSKPMIPSSIRKKAGRVLNSILSNKYKNKTMWIRWGSLRRLKPISSVFGFDRGQPIDRYYIETFLQRHNADIHGRVLEIGDPGYTRKFGGDRVTRPDVLHAMPGNPQATMVGDLATGDGIPKGTFDCMILTQTLLFIYDVSEAITNCYAALKSGGVLLATMPGISQISRYDMDRWGDYWRFTALSAKRLFGDVFQPENVTVQSYGNVLTAIAFLHGLAAEELRQKELDYYDPDYEVLITVRAVKPKHEK
jgi:SAM-dependent methyltransferase